MREVLDLWNELGISPSTEDASTSAVEMTEDSQLDLQILQTLRLTLSADTQKMTTSKPAFTATHATLQALQAKKASLQLELERREQEIQKLYDELWQLWKMLDITEEEMDDFVEQWAGTQQKCLEAVRCAPPKCYPP